MPSTQGNELCKNKLVLFLNTLLTHESILSYLGIRDYWLSLQTAEKAIVELYLFRGNSWNEVFALFSVL